MSDKFKKSGLRKKSICGAGSPEQQQCIICLDTDQLIERDKLLCGHSFHRRCINRWLGTSDSCPICRKPVYQPPQAHKTVNLQQQVQLNQVSQPQRSREQSPQHQMLRELEERLAQQVRYFPVQILQPQPNQTQELQLNPSGIRARQQLFTPQSGTTHEQQVNTARVQAQRPLFPQKSHRTYKFITNAGVQAQKRPLFPQPSVLWNPSGVQIQRQRPHNPTYQLSSSRPRLQHLSLAEQLKLHKGIVDDMLQESHERIQEERRLQEENKKLQEENKKSQEENKKSQEEIKKLQEANKKLQEEIKKLKKKMQKE